MIIDFKRLQRIKVPDEPWWTNGNQVCYVIICFVVVILFMRSSKLEKQYHTSHNRRR